MTQFLSVFGLPVSKLLAEIGYGVTNLTHQHKSNLSTFIIQPLKNGCGTTKEETEACLHYLQESANFILNDSTSLEFALRESKKRMAADKGLPGPAFSITITDLAR